MLAPYTTYGEWMLSRLLIRCAGGAVGDRGVGRTGIAGCSASAVITKAW